MYAYLCTGHDTNRFPPHILIRDHADQFLSMYPLYPLPLEVLYVILMFKKIYILLYICRFIYPLLIIY